MQALGDGAAGRWAGGVGWGVRSVPVVQAGLGGDITRPGRLEKEPSQL